MNNDAKVAQSLMKSCQPSFNFSQNLLNEDRKYLNQLASDIARKQKLHFSLGNLFT